MNQTPDSQLIPAAFFDLVAIFRDDLAGVKFPNVDQQSLEALADEVRARAAEVARAEEVLQAALAALESSQDNLAKRAGQALSYARVFAETDADLSAKLADITLTPGAAKRAKPTKGADAKPASSKASGRGAGRPRKADAEVDEATSEAA